MAIPDLTELTLEELQILISQANDAARILREQKINDNNQRKVEIASAISSLTDLLGDENSEPYNPQTGENATINGVLAHDTEDHSILSDNAGLAISLILRAMKIDVTSGINVARVISQDP